MSETEEAAPDPHIVAREVISLVWQVAIRQKDFSCLWVCLSYPPKPGVVARPTLQVLLEGRSEFPAASLRSAVRLRPTMLAARNTALLSSP